MCTAICEVERMDETTNDPVAIAFCPVVRRKRNEVSSAKRQQQWWLLRLRGMGSAFSVSVTEICQAEVSLTSILNSNSPPKVLRGSLAADTPSYRGSPVYRVELYKYITHHHRSTQLTLTTSSLSMDRLTPANIKTGLRLTLTAQLFLEAMLVSHQL